MLKKFFIGIFFLCVIFCSIYGLIPRMKLESKSHDVAIISDYREILTLAKNSGIEINNALEILKNKGLTALMVSELTGDNIDHGIGDAEFKITRDPERGTEGTIISILPGSPHKDLLQEWLSLRFSIDKKSGPVLIPLPVNMLKTSGIIPDIDGLEIAKKVGLKIYYRPAPSLGHLAENSALMLKKVHEKYPIDVFSPSGEIVSGYPNVSALAKTAKELNLPLAMVEFSRQVGANALNSLVSPMLMPLHSVTNEEMTARNITRKALRERLIRAAVERSVRLLLLRTAPPNTTNFLFEDFANEIELLSKGLQDHGFVISWPEPVFNNSQNLLHVNIFTSFAISAILIFSIYRYLSRMGIKENYKTNLFFIISGLILTVLVMKFSFIARISGAITAPMIAVEASLISMDLNKNRSLLKGFIFSLIGGIAIAAFFSVPSYMLRIQTFSGVKLTLILPPVLVLLHDLKNRIYPESLIEFMSRPPLWGELALCGILLAGVGLIIFRSGNVSFIPGFEARIRETLERILIARPRTREVFIGYPSLLVLNFLAQNKFCERLREIFRIGVVLGFSSVINSFCHFHTPVTLILLREFNGLWTGLLFGILIIIFIKFILIPLMKFLRPLVS